LVKHWNPAAEVVLYPGDCLKLLREIPDKSVQLVVTSPPYNIGKAYEKEQPFDEYLRTQAKVITECERVLKDGGSICWQVGNFVTAPSQILPLDIALYDIFKNLDLKLRNRVVWHYEHGLHSNKRFSGRYEVILWFTKGDNYTFNLDTIRVPQKYPGKRHYRGPKKGEYSGNPLGKNPGDVWHIPNVKHNHVEKTIHPCQFPVELVERLILATTSEGEWVLDPYMGVSTTGVAALLNARRAVGAELLDSYYRVGVNRLRHAKLGLLRVRPRSRPIFVPPENSSLLSRAK
jgi:adenine-specific DNA-methyltransferase